MSQLSQKEDRFSVLSRVNELVLVKGVDHFHGIIGKWSSV